MRSWIFHAGCGFIFAISLAYAIQGDQRARPITDPTGDLLAFLKESDLPAGEPAVIVAGELAFPIRLPSCSEPGMVLFLPSIHRISDPARLLIKRAADAVLVHDRSVVGSLGAGALMIRWIVRRLAVNLQLAEEDPWISIGLAGLAPAGCRFPALDWKRLSRRR